MNNVQYEVKKVYVIHDYGYAQKELIPSEAFDGKDRLTVEYIIIDSEYADWNEYDMAFDTNGRYDSLEEAQEEAEEMNK